MRMCDEVKGAHSDVIGLMFLLLTRDLRPWYMIPNGNNDVLTH